MELKELNKLKKLLVFHYILLGSGLIAAIFNLLKNPSTGIYFTLITGLMVLLSQPLTIWDVRKRLKKHGVEENRISPLPPNNSYFAHPLLLCQFFARTYPLTLHNAKNTHAKGH